MSKQTVAVSIDGREYKIKTDESNEHIFRITEKVNNMIATVRGGNNQLSSTMVAILTALNLSDELYKLKDQFKEQQTSVANNKAVEEMQGAIDSLKLELEKQIVRTQKSDEKIFYLQRKLTDKEEELNDARQELEDFINEIDS